ncbi:MAG: KAP family NTPase [Micrococcales bacterium]|nr:KAP family NTPase [Micrococcales bacterium]MCL2668594.1 KAP family NTPase [Micrococcales bacterium]
MRTANAVDSDCLKLDSYRKAFELIVTTAEPPSTVGLFGAGGSGKTSFLRRVQADLHGADKMPSGGAGRAARRVRASGDADETGRFQTVWFDLWEHQRHPAPVVAMLNVAREEILSELAERIRAQEKRGPLAPFWLKMKRRLRVLEEDTRLEELGESLVWGLAAPDLDPDDERLEDSVKRAAASRTPVPGALERSRELHKEQFRVLEEQSKLRKDLKDIVEQLISASEREGQGPDRPPLVVFIDDVDRCPGSVIVDLLEQIRLFLALARCVFVIAVDETVVARAVIDKSPEFTAWRSDEPDPAEEAKAEYAERYLEKIVQFPFTLPRLGEAKVKDFARDILAEVGFVDAELIQVHGVIGPVLDEQRDGLTLRFVVRLANALLVNHMITQGELGDGSTRSQDYDLRVTTLATVVQHVYPDDYKAAMSQPDGIDYLWRQLVGAPGAQNDVPLFTDGAVQLKAYARELAAEQSLRLDAQRFAQYLRYVQPVKVTAGRADDETVQLSRLGTDEEAPVEATTSGEFRAVTGEIEWVPGPPEEPTLALRGHNEWYYDKTPQKVIDDHVRRAIDGSLMDDEQTMWWMADEGASAVGAVVTIGGIPWRVLQVDSGKGRRPQALLLAEYVQGRSQWHDDREASLWGDEPGPWLRRELNGRFFDALPEHVRVRIPDTTWPQVDNKRYGTKTESVNGCISLLSIDEVGRFLRSADARRAVDPWGNASWWWLRSPGVDPAYVDREGNIVISGGKVSSSSGGVRPVLRLALDM